MALHRDIFWVGKQWAVTGYGMQAVDQKQKSKFDIEASRLWEDGLLENLSGQRWFNPEDFNAGLSVARARYPQAPEKAASRKKAEANAALVPATPPSPAATPSPPPSKPAFTSGPAQSVLKVKSRREKKRPPAQLSMRVGNWPAKFTKMWRIRINRK